MDRPHSWNYEEAFSRHHGIFRPDEQTRLRQSCVAIAGMGGIGGVALITLVRSGIGAFNIADPDSFETVNFNRQFGATVSSLGRGKVEVMATLAAEINPELKIASMPEALTSQNIEQFLEGAHIVVDGLDFFQVGVRRLLFHEARKRGLWVITAGPHAFGTGWLLFSPKGMSFDDYFDLHDDLPETEQILRLGMGLVPRLLHFSYVDKSKYIDPHTRQGGSVSIGCQLAAGVLATQVIKLLLGRPNIHPAPWYFQFDAYRGKLVYGYLWKGNRNPLQRLRLSIIRRRYTRPHSRVENPPGPKSLPLLGKVFALYRFGPDFLRTLSETYGDVVHYKMPINRHAYLLSHPDYVREVLVTQAGALEKTGILKRASRLWGNGLLVSDGEFHANQRRLMLPIFRQETIDGFAPVFVRHASSIASRWIPGKVNDISRDIHQATLCAVAETLLGINLESEAKDILDSVTALSDYFALSVIPFVRLFESAGIPPFSQYRCNIEHLNQTIYKFIDERRRTPTDANDLLTRLIATCDSEQNETMNDKQLHDELITLLLAGHETVATLLTWSCYLLSQHPEIETKFHKEIDDVCGSTLPRAATVNHLPFTQSILREAMRLHPPIWVLSRRTKVPVQIGAYTIPAGADLVVSPFLIHRDHRFFDRPFVFDPDRWETKESDRRHRYSYFPFGAGPHSCIGERFAMLEGALFLATIAQRFRFRLAANQNVAFKPYGITLQPASALRLIVEERVRG